jgi:hypothetical protein
MLEDEMRLAKEEFKAVIEAEYGQSIANPFISHLDQVVKCRELNSIDVQAECKRRILLNFLQDPAISELDDQKQLEVLAGLAFMAGITKEEI